MVLATIMTGMWLVQILDSPEQRRLVAQEKQTGVRDHIIRQYMRAFAGYLPGFFASRITARLDAEEVAVRRLRAAIEAYSGEKLPAL